MIPHFFLLKIFIKVYIHIASNKLSNQDMTFNWNVCNNLDDRKREII